MKTILATILACVICSCGHKPEESHDFSVWQISTTNGVSTEMCYTALTQSQMDSIFRLAAQKWSDANLTLYLSQGVGITESAWLLDLAEKNGITNITVKLNQTRPPSKSTGNLDIVYESLK